MLLQRLSNQLNIVNKKQCSLTVEGRDPWMPEHHITPGQLLVPHHHTLLVVGPRHDVQDELGPDTLGILSDSGSASGIMVAALFQQQPVLARCSRGLLMAAARRGCLEVGALLDLALLDVTGRWWLWLLAGGPGLFLLVELNKKFFLDTIPSQVLFK